MKELSALGVAALLALAWPAAGGVWLSCNAYRGEILSDPTLDGDFTKDLATGTIYAAPGRQTRGTSWPD